MDQGGNKFKSRFHGILEKVRTERTKLRGHVADFQKAIASASHKLSEIRASSFSSLSVDSDHSPDDLSLDIENESLNFEGESVDKSNNSNLESKELKNSNCYPIDKQSSGSRENSDSDKLDAVEREWLALTDDICEDDSDLLGISQCDCLLDRTVLENDENLSKETCLNLLDNQTLKSQQTHDCGVTSGINTTVGPKIIQIHGEELPDPTIIQSTLSLNLLTSYQYPGITEIELAQGSRLDIHENYGILSRSDTGNTCIHVMDNKTENGISPSNETSGKSLLSTPTEEPRNKSPITIQEWVDSLPLQEQAPRKEEDTAEEVESSTDWEVENLTLGAEAAIVCPPEPCPAVHITGCVGGSDAGSHCSSMESFLEARKPDPEELLLELGFGGPPTQNDNISRIPSRFLQPSHLKGVDIDQFLKQQQEMADTLQSSFNGYRGLTGRQHERPSVIVGKIMERLREAESGVNRARRSSMGQQISASDASPKLATVARNLLNRLRVVRAEGSVLSPDNRAWLEAQGDRSPEPKNKKLIIGKQSFTFSNDGKDLIPCKSRSPSRSPNSNRLSPRNGASEECLSVSPNRLSPRDINASENRLSPNSPHRSDKDLTSPKRLSPRNMNRSEDGINSSLNRLSPRNINVYDNLNSYKRSKSPRISKSDVDVSSVNNNSLRLRPDKYKNMRSSPVDNKHSQPIEIPISNRDVEISRHFASMCNLHRPVPRRRSAGFSDSEPGSSLERKISDPQVKSCGCRCHPVSSTPISYSPSDSTPSSIQDQGLPSFKEEADPIETEYKVVSELAAELTPSELPMDLVPIEQYSSLLDEERHGVLVGVLENALCAYEERLEALELGTGLTRVLYSQLDRVSRLLHSSDSHLLIGIAEQVTSLLRHQSSLKRELEVQEKETEMKLADQIS